MRIIKRYSNRRLYDTERRQTVTLDDVTELLKDNTPFSVQDNTSGEDVTLAVISQIISRELQEQHNFHVIPLLGKALVRKGGVNAMNVLKKTLLAGVGVFTLSKERLTEIVDELVQSGEMTDTERAEFINEWVDKVKAGSAELKTHVEKAVKDAVAKVKEPQAAEMKAMQSKLDAALKRINELEKEKTAASKKAAPKKAAAKKKPVKKAVKKTAKKKAAKKKKG